MGASLFLILSFQAVATTLRCPKGDVTSVSLGTQWGNTRTQDYGLCYAYAAVSLVEAALYRQDGTIRHLSPHQAAAICRVDPQSTSPRVPKDKIEAIQKKEDVSIYDRGFLGETVSSILKNQELSNEAAFKKNFVELNQDNANIIQKNQIPEIPLLKDWIVSETILQNTRDSLKKFQQSSPQKTSLKRLSAQTYPGNLSPRRCRTRDVLQKSAEIRRRLEQHLCVGIPIGISLSDVHGLLWSESVNSHQELVTGSGGHAAVVEGFLARGPNGQSGFLVRDTNGGPRARFFLSESELCRIQELTAVYAPGEQKQLRDPVLNSPSLESPGTKPASH